MGRICTSPGPYRSSRCASFPLPMRSIKSSWSVGAQPSHKWKYAVCQMFLINKIAHIQAIYIHTSAPTWSKHMPGGKPSCSGPYNLRDCKASALTMAEVTSRLYGSHIYGRVTGKWHVLQPCWPRHRHMQGKLQFRQ